MTNPTNEMVILSARQTGRSWRQEKMLAAYLKANPKATVATFRKGECIIEKYAGSTKEDT